MYLHSNRHRFSPSTVARKEDWLKIWNHKLLLPRHKLNWWHFISNCFPTREKLSSLFTINDTSYPIYASAPENMIHLLFFCDLSRHFWLASPWNIWTEALNCYNPLDGLKFLWSLEDNDLAASQVADYRNVLLFASVLLDLIWKYKNSITRQGPRRDPCALFETILQSYNSLFAPKMATATLSSCSWHPPPSRWIKINSDAAIGENTAGIACIARNDRGSILCCKSRRLGSSLPLVAEGLAIKLAIEMACNAGWPAMVFESDSKSFVEVVNLRKSADWVISTLVDNCFVKLAKILFWAVVFTPRVYNSLVHNFAS
ncbi:hypothetical protein UlMin_007178 [Ulmus minor]